MRNRTVQILIGLALTLGAGSLPWPVWDNEFADTAHLLGNEAIYWALVAATLVYVLRVERLPLASIGLRRPGFLDAAIGIAFAVVTVAGLAALYFVLFPILGLSEAQQIDQLSAAPGWWLAISVVRAGASEEVLFRGYPIERLQELTGSKLVALGLPWLVFTLAHAGSWGWTHVIVAGFGGAMLTALYAWRRNLWVSMVVHGLIDGIAVLG
jgi:membrane protease YdiL (CAAX protease family)